MSIFNLGTESTIKETLISVAALITYVYAIAAVYFSDFAKLRVKLLRHTLNIKVKSAEEETNAKLRFKDFKIKTIRHKTFKAFYTQFPKTLRVTNN